MWSSHYPRPHTQFSCFHWQTLRCRMQSNIQQNRDLNNQRQQNYFNRTSRPSHHTVANSTHWWNNSQHPKKVHPNAMPKCLPKQTNFKPLLHVSIPPPHSAQFPPRGLKPSNESFPILARTHHISHTQISSKTWSNKQGPSRQNIKSNDWPKIN